MNDFTFFSPETAPAKAQPLLDALHKKLGFIPNLYAGLAAAPAALKGALDLSAAFSQTSLSQQEQIVVSLTASVENGCEFCVAAHSSVARHVAEMDDASLTALRAGHDPRDPKLQALARFTRSLVNQHGWVGE
ncbi:MAG: carboxymuconolactone decarboxylase family protein, partial [Terriglobia bacterium]